MIIIIAVFVIFFAICAMASGSSSHSSSGQKPSAPLKSTSKPAAPTHINRAARTPITKQNFRQNLKTLTDREDLHLQTTAEVKQGLPSCAFFPANQYRHDLGGRPE